MARSVILDTSQVDALAASLASIDDATLGRANLVAVNAVTTRAQRAAREKMDAGVNLPANYIDDRLTFEPATDARRPVATVTSPYKGTGLGRFSAVQVTQPVQVPKRRRGDPGRSIPAGQKQAGLTVEVVRGQRKPISYAFVIPGIKSNDGTPVVFENTGPGGKKNKGKLKALTGLSVFQLFRHALDDQALDAIADDLEATTVVTTTHEIERLIRQKL